MSQPADLFGVVLMTYGSPSSLDDVPRYIRAVRGGRDVPPDVVEEMRRRYQAIGGSPLMPIMRWLKVQAAGGCSWGPIRI
jgi:protoheme ferro-lyase